MKQKNLVLMVVAVGCGLVAAFLTTQMNAKPKVEMVEVFVALDELPVGTIITSANLEKTVLKKPVAKDALPPDLLGVVIDVNDLLGKNLKRPLHKHEVFTKADLGKGSSITFVHGKHMVSLPMSAAQAAAGHIVPGSKVDVLATLKLPKKLASFPLLVDMHVLTVNSDLDQSKSQVFQNMTMVSLAVTQEQALLLSMAKTRGCNLELMLQNPEKELDTTYDFKKIKKLLEDDQTGIEIVPGDPGEIKKPLPSTTTEPIAPPVAKAETVKVLVANEDISAGTDINKELIETKFTVKDYPKDLIEGTVGDITPYLGGKVFTKGISKGQPIVESSIGLPGSKPSPQDDKITGLPKPRPDPEVAIVPPTVAVPEKKVEPKPAAKEFHDVAVHTASGTLVYRYLKNDKGELKLIATLSPEEAAKPKEAASGDAKKFE